MRKYIMMSEFLLERFGILKRLFLSEVEHSCFRPRNCLPKTNVSFIRTTHEILRVTRKCTGKDALHSFDVVAFSTSVLSLLEYSNCSVITCRDELSSCWRPVHVQDCIGVVYVNCECRSKLDTKINCRKKRKKLTFRMSKVYKLLSSFATVKSMACCGFQEIPLLCISNFSFFIGSSARTSYRTTDLSTVNHFKNAI
jgi:hypothetical protein